MNFVVYLKFCHLRRPSKTSIWLLICLLAAQDFGHCSALYAMSGTAHVSQSDSRSASENSLNIDKAWHMLAPSGLPKLSKFQDSSSKKYGSVAKPGTPSEHQNSW
jgi:hypothetical protein